MRIVNDSEEPVFDLKLFLPNHRDQTLFDSWRVLVYPPNERSLPKVLRPKEDLTVGILTSRETFEAAENKERSRIGKNAWGEVIGYTSGDWTVELWFTDATGIQWKRYENGQLERRKARDDDRAWKRVRQEAIPPWERMQRKKEYWDQHNIPYHQRVETD